MFRVKRTVCMATLLFMVHYGAIATSFAAEEKSSEATQQKDFYVGGFGGWSFPDDSTLKNSWSGGLKVGWVLPPVSYGQWFNWEFEYWYQNLHIKQQNLTIGNLTITAPGLNGHAHTFASNFILRRPTGIIRPYAGAGPSVVFVDFNGPGAADTSSTAFGANVLVGSRVMFSKTLGVFAEYKRNWAFSLEFNRVRSDLNSNALVGGLVWEFDNFWLP